MQKALTNFGTVLRARWRWTRGRCPHCNRKLFLATAHYMASHPRCFCLGATQADSQLWNMYQDMLVQSENDMRRVAMNETVPIIRKDVSVTGGLWDGDSVLSKLYSGLGFSQTRGHAPLSDNVSSRMASKCMNRTQTDGAKTQSKKEAMAVAEKTGKTAILVKGQVCIVPEPIIQEMLANQTPFAFLRLYGGVITEVPMH
jgi:hypothetical protein